jgi:UDP-N-acetylmuramate--alanine ligase
LLGHIVGALVVVFSAHHPPYGGAPSAGARAAAPDRRLVIAFQPHLFSRTRDFAREFAEALAGADVVYLADIYPAREQPIPGVTSDLIADAMAERGCAPAWRGGVASLAPALASALRPGDLVVTMGAGDVTHVGPALLATQRAAAT